MIHKKGLNCSLLIFAFSALWTLIGIWVGVVFLVKPGISMWLTRDIRNSFGGSLLLEDTGGKNFYEYFASRHYIIKISRISSSSDSASRSVVLVKPLVKKGTARAIDFFSFTIKIGNNKYRFWYTAEFFLSYIKEKIILLVLFGVFWLMAGIFVAHLINLHLLFNPLKRLADGTISPAELVDIRNKKCSPFADIAKAFDEARTQMSLYSRHSALLLQAAKSIASQVELNHAISMILDLVVEKFPGTSACVVLLDDDGYMRIKNSRGLSADFIKKIRLRRGEGFVGECIESKKTIIVQDADAQKNSFTSTLLETENIKSFIHIPIIVENRAAGAFNINAYQKDYFTQEILGVAATLSEYLSIAISNARLYERLRDFNRRLETEVSYTTSELLKTNAKLVKKIRMLRVAMDIFSALESADGKSNISESSYAEIISRIFSRIRDVLNVDFGVLMVSNGLFTQTEDNNMSYRLVHRFAGFKEPENNFPPADLKYTLEKLGAPVLSALKDGKPLIKNSIPAEENQRWSFVPKEIFLKNYFVVPIISHHYPLAVAFFGNKMGGEGFDDEDMEFMSLVAPRVGFYIYCKKFCRLIEEQNIKK